MKRIPLSQGYQSLVDDADYALVSKYKWSVLCWRNRNYRYAVRTVKRNGKSKTILMHRVILNAPKGVMVDHINQNGLDNRRSNLRLCSNRQNQQNACSHVNSSSKYKGVSWARREQKWDAQINYNGRNISLGQYTNEDDAARAYNEAATKMFGKFARLNCVRARISGAEFLKE